MAAANNEPRSHYEACCDVRYHLRLAVLTGRFYGRMKALFSFVQLFGGSAAFAGAIASNAPLAGAAGFVLAGLAIVEHIVDPAPKMAKCDEMRRAAVRLIGVCGEKTLADIDHALAQLREIDAPSIESLRLPAYNDMVRAESRDEYVATLTVWQRFMHFMAA